MLFKYWLVFLATSLFSKMAIAQIPCEVFIGHKKSTVDILFFRYFKNKKAENSAWLFFNRNRASVDFSQTTSTNLPQFGFTEAISYNPKKWKGVAPVGVIQILNTGVYPKLGFQFGKSGKNYSVFTWLVSEVLQNPNVDLFFLGRFLTPLNAKRKLFTQIELVNTIPSHSSKQFNFIQRIRLGLKFEKFQLGLGADFTATGKRDFKASQNIGTFFRYEW